MKTITAGIWLMLLALSLIWGGAFVFNGLALASFAPFTIVAMRLVIGAIVLNLVLAATGRRYPASPGLAGRFLLLGLLNNALPFTLIVWGQTGIAAGTASIINATTPLFTIVLAHFFTRDEKLDIRRLLGVVVGILGVVVLFGTASLHGAGERPLFRLAVLGAGLSYSVAGIYGKRFGREGIDPLTVAAGQLTASSLITIPLALAVDRPWAAAAPQTPAVLAVLGLGVLSSALAYILYFRILQTSGAGNALLVTMIIPFFALFLGNLLLAEPVRLREIIALLILVAGLLIVDGRVLRLFRRPGHAGSRRTGPDGILPETARRGADENRLENGGDGHE